MEPQWDHRISGTESQINEDNEDKHLRTNQVFFNISWVTGMHIFGDFFLNVKICARIK